MSGKSADTSRPSKSMQLKRASGHITSEVPESNKKPRHDIVIKNSQPLTPAKNKTPNIIRIVPSNISSLNILGKKTGKTVAIKGPKIVKVTTAHSRPSTSNQSSDADYLCKSENLVTADHEYVDFEEVNDEFEELTTVCSATDEVQEFLNVKSTKPTIYIANNITDMCLEKKINIHNETCCCSCRETLEIIMRQQQEILSHVRKGFWHDKKLDLLPPMPFNDMNDFLDFDESLTNENVQGQFEIKLKKLLVSTDQKSVANIMGSLMTNELCKNISWIGVKDSVAFGTTNMVGLIMDILQEHHSLDIDVIKNRIAEWLRRCGDRIFNENRKASKRKQMQEVAT